MYRGSSSEVCAHCSILQICTTMIKPCVVMSVQVDIQEYQVGPFYYSWELVTCADQEVLNDKVQRCVSV